MASAEVMAAVYRALLDELERRAFPVGPRLRLSTPRKLWVAARARGPRLRPRMKVVVVGGGFAGLAAAIALQERRHEVTLLERRGVLGGRATSYPGRGDRRRRGQRHAPHDRGRTRRPSTSCGVPAPRTS